MVVYIVCLASEQLLLFLTSQFFEKECIKTKPRKYKVSLVSSEMGELEKRSERKEENATETSARIMSSVCITCCKLKEPFRCLEKQLAVSPFYIPDVTGMQSRMLVSV